MNRTFRAAAVAAVLALVSSSYCEDSSTGKTVTIRPEITQDVLPNAGMGLFIMPGLTGDYDKDWYMPYVSVAYFREDWAALEPEEGRFRFDETLDPAFAYWLARGKRVALRVMSSNMHSRREYVSPRWVFDADAPGITHKGLYAGRQVDPVFWDPAYIEKQASFIRALGKKYNGMKGLEFVDLGAVGEWGESHLMRWTSEEKERTAYAPTAYTKAYMRFIDLYREAFPDTPLALNCWMGNAGHNDVIVDYAVSKGIWLRQDGLTPDYPREGASAYFNRYFQRVKTLYELRLGYGEMAEQGMTPLDTFNRGFGDPISYLNLMGTWEVKNLSKVDRDACIHAATRIGYRLAPIAVERPDAIRLDASIRPRLGLAITWKNFGAAPCYESLAIEITLVDKSGKSILSVVEMPEKPTTTWMPGEETVTRHSILLPVGLKPGDYTLKLALASWSDVNRRIFMPLKGRDAEGRYALSELSALLATGPAVQPQIPGASFENAAVLKQWWFAKGITATLSSDSPAQGKNSLKLEGKSAEGWNYAGSPFIPLIPGAEYMVSAKMKAISVSDPGRSPYVKIGLHEAGGKFIGNENSGAYDLDQPGTWQELKILFVAPASAGFGYFAVEKGATIPLATVLYLDDVQIRILSMP